MKFKKGQDVKLKGGIKSSKFKVTGKQGKHVRVKTPNGSKSSFYEDELEADK